MAVKNTILGKLALCILVVGISALMTETVYAAGASKEAKEKALAISMLIAPEGMTEYDKVIAVHDWLCTNCTYNVTSISNGVVLNSDHSADGPLIFGTAVCEGYSEAFKVFMDILGVKNRRIDGWTQGGYHSWNEVFIGDHWLAVDVTWDDPVIIGGPDPGGVYTRQYCLIAPEQMAVDHMACEYY